MNERVFQRIMWLSMWTAILVIVFIVTTGAAHAAPRQPDPSSCRPGAFLLQDIAGTYESRYVLVEAFPCGGVSVLWMNNYGEHSSVYYAEQRIKSGGVFATGYMPDPELQVFLDRAPYIALTPAEPGWIYLTTITEQGGIVKQYRLNKTT